MWRILISNITGVFFNAQKVYVRLLNIQKPPREEYHKFIWCILCHVLYTADYSIDYLEADTIKSILRKKRNPKKKKKL